MAGRKRQCEERFNRDFDEAAEQNPGRCTDLRGEIVERTLSYAEKLAAEAGGEAPVMALFVQHAEGGRLDASTLSLQGVGHLTNWVAHSPYRAAGQLSLDDFVASWRDENVDANPPHADFTCEVDGEVVHYEFELTEPSFDGADLTFTSQPLDPLDGSIPLQCGPASLSILNLNSYAGLQGWRLPTMNELESIQVGPLGAPGTTCTAAPCMNYQFTNASFTLFGGGHTAAGLYWSDEIIPGVPDDQGNFPGNEYSPLRTCTLDPPNVLVCIALTTNDLESSPGVPYDTKLTAFARAVCNGSCGSCSSGD